jgi:hypothetical protein
MPGYFIFWLSFLKRETAKLRWMWLALSFFFFIPSLMGQSHADAALELILNKPADTPIWSEVEAGKPPGCDFLLRIKYGCYQIWH